MGHIAEAEVESGRIFAQRLVRSPYLKSWDASWPDSGRGIAELRSARKYGGLNQRYFDGTSPPIEPRCTAADCAEVGLGSLGRRLREHCSGKPLLRPSSALVGKPVPVVMVNSMCLGNYDPRAGGRPKFVACVLWNFDFSKQLVWMGIPCKGISESSSYSA